MHRFGITGYEKQEQRLWERERAIMLGAKVILAHFVLGGDPTVTMQGRCKKHCEVLVSQDAVLHPFFHLMFTFMFSGQFSVNIWKINIIVFSDIFR